MDRADIARIAERRIADVVAHPPANARDYSIRMTSGTTGGRPFLTIWRGKDASGLQSGASRYLLAWGPRAMRLSNMLFFRNDPANAGNLAIAIDAVDTEEKDTHLIDEFGPTTIYGFPSFVARVAQRIGGEEGQSVDIVALSGEALSKGVAELFGRKFPRARTVMTWASAETGVITKLPCAYLRKNAYHPRDDVTIKIESPDSDGIGLLLIGKVLDEKECIERYKTGDVARLDTKPCPCGERVTFELLGRAGHDYIKLVGALLRQEEFDRAAGMCRGLLEDYRVEAQEIVDGDALRGKITLKVFHSGGVSETARARIADIFSSTVFVTPSQTLGMLAGKGILLPLSVVEQREAFPEAAKGFKFISKK